MVAIMMKFLNAVRKFEAWLFAALLVPALSWAEDSPLDTIRKQAKTVDLGKTQSKIDQTVNMGSIIIIAVVGLFGLGLFAYGCWGIWSNSKDDRSQESIKGPVIAVIIGAVLIILPIAAGFLTGIVQAVFTTS